MKQKKITTKKVMELLLAVAMIITLLPAFSTTVHATELPDSTQFATVEELKEFNTNDNDGEVNPAKVYFGDNNQQWWIAGSQSEDSIVLFATSPLATNQQFHPTNSNIIYDRNWKCAYSDGEPEDVYPNHYGASSVRNILQGLESSYFTNDEQKLMKYTSIYTNDTKNNSVYSTTDKLYLAHGDYGNNYITVGMNSNANLNDGLRVDRSYCGNSGSFWIRAPYWSPNRAMLMNPNNSIFNWHVSNRYALVSAFELNLSSVLFGSTAPAISIGGNQFTKDAFTLRYKSDNLGSAQVSLDKSKVNLSNVPSETYLVAQNSDVVHANEVKDTSISAEQMGLESFENCKVWLETTDTTNRMTYATLATEEQEFTVDVTLANGMEIDSGSLTQKVTENQKIEDIVIKAQDGYIFPADYAVETQNGITVTRNSENQITISGTPTADVTITLPQATKKTYSMALSGSGTFTGTCVGYDPVTANEFTITNTGNVDLKNVSVSITGSDADKFDLNKDTTTTIQPNGTIKVTVKPNDSLAIGTYQATLTVSADNATDVTTNLQFTVSEHDYEAVVTPPSCTQKGYTTYTCKNCNDSYTGDETENLNPSGHKWETEYTVDKEPTCTTDGSKSIHCKDCNAVKDSEVIPRLEHSFTNYVSNNDATCTQDGTKTAQCDNGCGETDTVADTGSMLEHEFKNYVSDDNATCTENSTETAKCEHCDETDTRTVENSALSHKWGEWKVIKEATATATGKKERICERCGTKETEVIPVISTEDTNKPNTDKPNTAKPDTEKPNNDKGNGSVETGDQTNMGLYLSLLGISGLFTAILAVFRKKKTLENRER